MDRIPSSFVFAFVFSIVGIIVIALINAVAIGIALIAIGLTIAVFSAAPHLWYIWIPLAVIVVIAVLIYLFQASGI